MNVIWTHTKEMLCLCIPIAATFCILGGFGYILFKPDIVNYECPRVQQGQKLTSSTYDGKIVTCSYVMLDSVYGRGVSVRRAIETR